MKSHLLEFYGEECPYCIEVNKMIDMLEAENPMVHVERLEIWHNKENDALVDVYDKDYCGGIPFFINTKTNKWICGETTYEELKDWAHDK